MRKAEMAIPHLFRCPISLDLFTDPVTLCTGQTYDRPSIEKWLASGNFTCPVTMQRLHDPSMVPNHTLRHLIHQWLQIGPQFDPNFPQMSDPDASIAAALKQSLESHESTLENKLQTLETIQVLSQELPSQKSSLIQLGFFSLLLELVFKAPAIAGSGNGQMHPVLPSQNSKLVEQALVCVLKLLPYGSMGHLNMLKEESKLDYFLVLLDQGTITTKTSLCQLIEAISSSLETKDLCSMLGNNCGVLRRLILLLRVNSGASEAGIKAISALCSLESNRENLVRQGAVDGLIMYIFSAAERHERNLALPKAMATFELLLGLESAKQVGINHPIGVDALVKMVFRVSDHEGSESAINSLMILCSESVQARERAIGAGVLTQLLLLLQSQCRGGTKTKARMLLKLLRSMWAEDSIHV